MNVRLEYTLHFSSGVHWRGELIMNGYRLTVAMITNVRDSELTNIAFERLKHFINEEIDSSIFINSEEQEACRLYTAAGIKITTLPLDPVDQIVGVVLFQKLNAIMEGRIAVLETEVSSHLGDNMVYLHSENETAEDLQARFLAAVPARADGEGPALFPVARAGAGRLRRTGNGT